MIYRFQAFNENIQQAKSILKNLSIPETNRSYIRIKKLLEGHEGYIGFFTKIHFRDKVGFNELTWLRNNIVQGNFKGLKRNLVEYDSYEELIDDIERLELLTDAKKMYNEFPSEQKGFIDLNSDSDLNLLKLLNDRDDKKNFLRKISSFHNKRDLISRLKGFLNSNNSNNFDEILKDIKRVDASVLYSSKEDNIIICKIDKYSQCKDLGSDTSWCIVGSEHTFKSYVPDVMTNQFIIYLTDRETTDTNKKIGVTWGLKGYSTAHDIRDSHVSREKLKNILQEYNVDIDILKVGKDSIKDIESAKINMLILVGYTFEEIAEKKKRYSKSDMEYMIKNAPESI